MPELRYEWHEGREMASELIKRHPILLKAVPPLHDILFIMDEESAPKSKGRLIGARVSKIPAKFDDLLEAGDKVFMLEWFKWHTELMTRNQRYLLMFHELCHFEYDEQANAHKLCGHDIEEFYLIADRFGLHWNSETHGDVPDIMDSAFVWGREGQALLDMAETERINRELVAGRRTARTQQTLQRGRDNANTGPLN